MKRIQFVLLAFSLLFLLTACGREEPSQESNGQITNPSSQQESGSASEAVSEPESTESGQPTNNTLIVYFSRRGNTEYPFDVDATTSASMEESVESSNRDVENMDASEGQPENTDVSESRTEETDAPDAQESKVLVAYFSATGTTKGVAEERAWNNKRLCFQTRV